MRTVAIIPARGGSRGVPGKNVALVGGVPLVVRAVQACLDSHQVDLCVVTTDDATVATAALTAGARVVSRPPVLAGDEASSESAVLHALDALRADGIAPDTTVLVQCTSPFLRADDLDAAIGRVVDGEADCVFAAVATHEFLWRDTGRGRPGTSTVIGLNHDPAGRLRRQDRRPDLRETGAFYVMRTQGFRRYRHRFFGLVSAVPVDPATAIEIDTPDDLELARAIAGWVDARTHDPHPTEHHLRSSEGIPA